MNCYEEWLKTIFMHLSMFYVTIETMDNEMEPIGIKRIKTPMVSNSVYIVPRTTHTKHTQHY